MVIISALAVSWLASVYLRLACACSRFAWVCARKAGPAIVGGAIIGGVTAGNGVDAGVGGRAALSLEAARVSAQPFPSRACCNEVSACSLPVLMWVGVLRGLRLRIKVAVCAVLAKAGSLLPSQEGDGMTPARSA